MSDPIRYAAENVVRTLLEQTCEDNIPESIRREWGRWVEKREPEFVAFVEQAIRDLPHVKLGHEIELIALTGYLPDGHLCGTHTQRWVEGWDERLRANPAAAGLTG